jgi:putative hydrolase of HD superfamily
MTIPTTLPPPPFQHLLTWLQTLKETPRSGWIRSGVNNPESIADHSFGVALLALFFSAEFSFEGDRSKLLSLALIHDLGEALIGDRIVFDSAEKTSQKQRDELAAFEVMEAHLNQKLPLSAMFRELEAGQTPESRLIRQLDKLEMLITALFYQNELSPERFEQFANSALKALEDPRLQQLATELLVARSEWPKRPEPQT